VRYLGASRKLSNVRFIEEFRNDNWRSVCCCDAVLSNSSSERNFTAHERMAKNTVLMKARNGIRQ
jgi:hypothetical protein